jgi:hypothetical protein
MSTSFYPTAIIALMREAGSTSKMSVNFYQKLIVLMMEAVSTSQTSTTFYPTDIIALITEAGNTLKRRLISTRLSWP